MHDVHQEAGGDGAPAARSDGSSAGPGEVVDDWWHPDLIAEVSLAQREAEQLRAAAATEVGGCSSWGPPAG
ncbi:hypothetical protein GPECTOR_18g47 [Gonium pectorale]|uniref:Uncharacterized protein n=1 Tax=Gonium pectorale TaxID=33097 RepID=A0A150GJS0_GONPE|nr:hypothetical protein GPECTOR_18g47 [Gonium pectorale]|eukprot:KXZ50068.1 hypothetical protein GPECTOR_18g47 [Gonium pectorale]